MHARRDTRREGRVRGLLRRATDEQITPVDEYGDDPTGGPVPEGQAVPAPPAGLKHRGQVLYGVSRHRVRHVVEPARRIHVFESSACRPAIEMRLA